MGKNVRAFIICVLVFVLSSVAGAETEFEYEDMFPDVQVQVALTDEHAEYLGLPVGTEGFRFSDIQAEYVLFDVYSLYCSPCQKDAPALNAMFEKIERLGLAGRLKFVGIAAGNTEREVAFWRKRFDVRFPLIQDEDYDLHRALGEVGTPTLFLVRMTGPDQLDIVLAHVGAFKNTDTFFATLLAQIGHDVAQLNLNR